MEFFLNLCWFALLLPAYLLWRQRVSSEPWTRASFVIVCTLGCAIVLLFPVISASDDLHAVSQAMEESERGLRHAGHCAGSMHSLSHAPLAALLSSASLHSSLEKAGPVLAFVPNSSNPLFSSRSSSRAPPTPLSASL